EKDNLIDRLNAEYAEYRDKVQAADFDPLAADPLEKWLKDHDERMSPPPVGGQPNTDRGIALRTYHDNQRRLAEDVDDRLADLFRFRVETLGLADTLALLESYDKVNQPRLKSADQLRGKG